MVKVLGISYGRHLFEATDKERLRMEACAATTSGYHMVVFTHRREGFKDTTGKDGLFMYPTNARVSIAQPLCAFYRAWQVVRHDRTAPWVVTAQDSFIAGLVGWLLAVWFGLPLNVQEHGGEYNGPYWRQRSVTNQVLYQLGLFILRRATTIRVVSQRSKDTLMALGYKPERLLFLPVRSDQIEIATATPAAILPFPSGTIVVLTLARLVPQKNLSLLIEAIATLVARGFPVGLCIVGSGPEERKLKALVAAKGITDQVVFVPWTDTPAAYFKAADLYALTSDWEGWARVLPEAMAYGLPIVSTDVGCAGEVVVDGEHGFVVPVRAQQRFTERLTALVTDEILRARFKAAALTDSRKQQTLAEYAAAWAAILETTMTRFHQS